MGLSLKYSKKFVDFLLPDSQAEKLIFRRFPGSVLQAAAVKGTAVKSSSIQTVTLKINPKNLQFSKRKIIQKVQTSAPNRFIVFDWGHELTSLAIEGVTGNLLPESITDGVLDPVADPVIETLSLSPGTQEKVTQSSSWKKAKKISNSLNENLNDLMFGQLKYSELLELSPKYKTFKRLENIYDESDADNDIITLELAGIIYRGFFEEFSFTVSAESPWSWNYNLIYIILENVTERTQKSAEEFKLEGKTVKE